MAKSLDVVVDELHKESGAKFWFEPSCLWWHDVASVCDVGELFHGDGVKSECDAGVSIVYPSFQLGKTTDSAYEVDARGCSHILDAENWGEDIVGEYAHVENADWVGIIVGPMFGCELVPLALEVHGELVKGGFST